MMTPDKLRARRRGLCAGKIAIDKVALRENVSTEDLKFKILQAGMMADIYHGFAYMTLDTATWVKYEMEKQGYESQLRAELTRLANET